MAKQARPIHGTGRLGRGLSSLIGAALKEAEPAPSPPPAERLPSPLASVAAPESPPGDAALLIPVNEIAPNPHQPRRRFDADSLAELTASVARQGILQALLVVRQRDPHAARPYVLIAGERRLRAAKEAGLADVPCLVREATEEQMLEWSLIENIQRSDLNAVERAQAYRGYMDRFDLTQAEVAERTGEARATIANYLRMLDLCDGVQRMLIEGQLTFGHARAVAALAGRDEAQRRLAERILRDGLSVRQAERLASELTADPGAEAPGQRARPAKAAYVADVERRLTEAVGTRVSVLPGRGPNRGRIVIEYYSLDDFDRIAGSLGLGPEA
ncbi:MAG TPA: ParB/RepB/Spo0J family partition protein [Phycisphaerae bacterium]|nr:ParB/RepB/Spo0J family partition protein [Phycisphaerae bacterium]